MPKIAQVVDGEASESESEIEIGKSTSPRTAVHNNTGAFVVAGEAPESDDESRITSPVLAEPDTPSSPSSPENNLMHTNYNSLLHQKLWECNVSLRATVEGLLRYTTDISVEKLARADKTLLTVQESMRATNASLALARARLRQVHTALDDADCAAAMPTVKIKPTTPRD